MRTQHFTKRAQGLTWIEVVMVVAVLGLLAVVVLLPTLSRGCGGGTSQRINCINNLKQIGLGFRLFANDNDGRFPSSTNDAVQAWSFINELRNELSSPRVLICPADTNRSAHARNSPTDFESMENGKPATNNFSHLTNRDRSLSYFVGLDANETNTQMILTGDRNLMMEPRPSGNIWTLSTNNSVGWTEKIHNKQGNLGVADGSVLQMTNHKLIEQLRNTGDTTNRIVMPR